MKRSTSSITNQEAMQIPQQAPRFTKIVATLGPAVQNLETMKELLKAGANVLRINASHGDHSSQRYLYNLAREAAETLGHTICILYDLQGPKIRLGLFNGVVELEVDQLFHIAVGRKAKKGELPSGYDKLDRDVNVGDPVLFDDGNLISEVIAVSPGTVTLKAKNAGTLSSRKGINLPKSNVSIPALTTKDREDAVFGAKLGADVMALSFVRKSADILELRDLLKEHGANTPILAKIEKPQAVDNLSDILEVAWGVMVARGDLGVELPPEHVPAMQKKIIEQAVHLGKPVITATQMLESMRDHPRPTRAEASDVANAVLDQTDAVMLSAETATGKYPIESVAMMRRIIESTEASEGLLPRQEARDLNTKAQSIANAACHVAIQLNARAIVAYTRTGRTAGFIARRRVKKPLVVFTPEPSVCNRLNLLWGARPHCITRSQTLDERISALDATLTNKGIVKAGDVEKGEQIVLCMSAPQAPAGSTNILIVHALGEKTRENVPATLPHK